MSAAPPPPPIELPLDQRAVVAAALADLAAIGWARAFTGDLLLSGRAEQHLQMGPPLAAAVARLGEENMTRWRRLHEVAPLIAGLGDRLKDAHVERGLHLAEANGSVPGVATFRQRAQAEGGPAAYVRARLARVPEEFASELDRAVALYRYFLTWPGGFRAAGPGDLGGPATQSAFGCAYGIAEVAVGGIGFGITVGLEVASAGVATPVVFFAAGASAACVGGGAATAAAEC